jgi:hypothetical protein
VEQRCLSFRIFAQLIYVIHAAGLRFLLFSLVSPLCFLPLLLLAGLFFLALCKRRSALWHTRPLCVSVSKLAGNLLQSACRHFALGKNYQRGFTRLTGVTTVIVATTAASTAKALAAPS